MISLSVLAALALAQAPNGDTLRLRLAQLPESALVAECRTRPLDVREAFGDALAAAVNGPPRSRQEALLAADRLAAAYALAWSDSLFVREVTRFAAASLQWRVAKVWLDSMRRVGIIAYGRDGPRRAIAVWRRGLARATALKDTVAIASMLGNIGAALWREGQLDSAERYLERAQRFAAATGDKRVEANALGTLANVSADRGELAEARERYTRALAHREAIGDSRGVAADHNNLGLLAQSVGDMDEARRRFETALDLNRTAGREDVAATNLVNLAALATLTGDFAHAVTLYRAALVAWQSRNMWAESADAFRGLGQLGLRRGDYP
ncbi:MAG: tetratricopeptide repeat protein, partial [Gemmatimonadetes bacterium]|nr:tetratricopeptide repeat protein [Gemmatimonadota bacterium]